MVHRHAEGAYQYNSSRTTEARVEVRPDHEGKVRLSEAGSLGSCQGGRQRRKKSDNYHNNINNNILTSFFYI